MDTATLAHQYNDGDWYQSEPLYREMAQSEDICQSFGSFPDTLVHNHATERNAIADRHYDDYGYHRGSYIRFASQARAERR